MISVTSPAQFLDDAKNHGPLHKSSILMHGCTQISIDYEETDSAGSEVDESDSSEILCYIGGPNEGDLRKFIDDVCSARAEGDDDLFNDVRQISFNHFEFSQLPSNVIALFPSLSRCSFNFCPNLSSLETTVQGLTHLEGLYFQHCPALKSLSSLATIPARAPIYKLHFKYCGLIASPSDDWEAGIKAIARTRRHEEGFFELDINECHDLKCLPSSLHHLNTKNADSIRIIMKDNSNLERLPFELSDVQNLTNLTISNCPSLSWLPWTLSRLEGPFELWIYKNIDAPLNSTLSNAGAVGRIDESWENLSIFTIQDMEPYFKVRRKHFFWGLLKLTVLISRTKARAVQRLSCRRRTNVGRSASKRSWQET